MFIKLNCGNDYLIVNINNIDYLRANFDRLYDHRHGEAKLMENGCDIVINNEKWRVNESEAQVLEMIKNVSVKEKAKL